MNKHFIVAMATYVLSSIAFADNVSSERNIELLVGRADIINLSAPASRVSVGEPLIADVKLINAAEIYILGKKVGRTNVIYWNKSGKSAVLEINVGIDIELLKSSYRQFLPKEKDLFVGASSDSIVLSGYVSDAVAADAALDLADSFMRNQMRVTQQVNQQAGGGSSSVNPQSRPQIINLLKIRDAQQVMLEVKIAEISKSLLEQLGVNLTNTDLGGKLTTSIGSNFSTNSAGVANLIRTWKNGALNIGVDAQKNDSLVKVLAEPTIVAMSGREGSFNVGGTLFIPQISSVGAASTVEVPFGIGLKFLPTVLDDGRINLNVSSEVSEVGKELVLKGTAGAESIIPTLTSRKVSTTVQLREGQNLVIGGLLKNNISETIKAFPVLGEIPILGALFRSKQFVSDKSELVILVRPVLVSGKNIEPELPTDKYTPPSRSDFFLGN